MDTGGVKFTYEVSKLGLGLGLGLGDDEPSPTPAAALPVVPAKLTSSVTAFSAASTVEALAEAQVIRCSTAVTAPVEEDHPQANQGAEVGDEYISFGDEQEEGGLPDQQQQEQEKLLGEFIEVPRGDLGQKDAAGKSVQPKGPSEEDIVALGKRPYWIWRCQHIKSPMLRLHQEIVELVELLQPTDEEVEARSQAVAEVAEAVQAIWPAAEVQVFGSFATGLFVPTSDVDLVIMNSRCTDIPAGLKALATSLGRKQIAKSVQVIAKARVPIIKFETKEYGGLAFDVSFDVANGPQAADLVKEYVGSWPMMRPLVLILKLFLQQRELNEVYSGGIGSYALITMVAAFLQLHTSRRPKAKGNSSSRPGSASGSTSAPAALLEPSLGVLLVDFFRLFGRVVNLPEVGLSAVGGGRFFHKDDKPDGGWSVPDRPFLLSVEDPKDPSNDIGRNSYNIRLVKAAFDFAYQQLTAPSPPQESLLARILRLGPILASRKAPADPLTLYKRPLARYVDPKQQAVSSTSNGGGAGGNREKGDVPKRKGGEGEEDGREAKRRKRT